MIEDDDWNQSDSSTNSKSILGQLPKKEQSRMIPSNWEKRGKMIIYIKSKRFIIYPNVDVQQTIVQMSLEFSGAFKQRYLIDRN